jgi:hypothetical protein
VARRGGHEVVCTAVQVRVGYRIRLLAACRQLRGYVSTARIGSRMNRVTYHPLRHLISTHLPRSVPLFLHGPSPRFPLPTLHLGFRIVLLLMRPDLMMEV